MSVEHIFNQNKNAQYQMYKMLEWIQKYRLSFSSRFSNFRVVTVCYLTEDSWKFSEQKLGFLVSGTKFYLGFVEIPPFISLNMLENFEENIVHHKLCKVKITKSNA